MADSNLFALNELLEKIKAGEGTAKTNLEALNMLCLLSGGQGGHKTNLDALNEILSVFSPASPSQEKNLSVTENGDYEVVPDEGYVLEKVGVSVAVPSLPEQAKTVTITENGTTEIVPDEGYTLSSVTAEVSVASEGGEIFLRPEGFLGDNLYRSIEQVDLRNFTFGTVSSFSGFLSGFQSLKEVVFPQGTITLGTVDLYGMFNICNKLTKIDLSAFSFKAISGLNYFAYNCFDLKTATFGAHSVPINGYANYLFYNCLELVTCDISALSTAGVKGLTDAFFNCEKLENLLVGKNFLASALITSFNLSTCNALSHDSLVHVFARLATRTNGPTLKIGATNLAKLTEAEIAVATDKGWSVV